MRLGILSDIHSNLEALTSCIEHLKAQGCDHFLVLGDIIGYGANPNECCEIVRSLKAPCLRGNHEEAVLNPQAREDFNPAAQEAVEWTAKNLSSENLQWLASLPKIYKEALWTAVHGSLSDPINEYLVDESSARETFMLLHTPICWIGHSHIASAFLRKEDSLLGIQKRNFPQGGTLKIEPGFQYIINCGSVGQPRDRNPLSACGLWDSEAGVVFFFRVNYNIALAQEKILQAGLPEILALRLSYGW